MEKPIISTTLRGLFLKSEPWKKAHILWFEEASRKLGDLGVRGYAYEKNYFARVDEVMRRIYPNIPEKERTIKARKSFFDSVCDYMERNPGIRNEDFIDYFSGIKDSYQLALITGNKSDAIERILLLGEMQGLFDIIEASLPEEKDDKVVVFKRFLKKHGKPIIYIGGDREDSYDYCKRAGIPCVYANLEGGEEIVGIESVHNLEQIKKRIKML